MEVTPPWERPKLSGSTLYWPNGVEATILGAADPERFRGPQFSAAWSDEISKWPHAEAAWDMLQFGLRLGRQPRQMATTTPRPTKLLKRLLADRDTVVTRMTTADNRKHLAQNFLSAVVARYRGTVLGRQELDGELIEDLPGALWTRDMFRRWDGERVRPGGRRGRSAGDEYGQCRWLRNRRGRARRRRRGGAGRSDSEAGDAAAMGATGSGRASRITAPTASSPRPTRAATW